MKLKSDTRGKSGKVKTEPGKAITREPARAGKKRSNPPLSMQHTNILDRISDGFVAFDAGMNYTYVNQKGAEMLGRKPADLVGRNYWVEYPEAKGTPLANAYVKALKTQETLVIEDYYAPWDRWFENRIYPSKEGLTIFFSEITEKKKAEEELRASERRLSSVIANSPDIIYILDLSTGQAPLFNREKFFGYSRVEMEAPGSILAAVHPDDLPRVRENWKQSMTGKGSPVEYRLRMKSGEIVWISQRVTILGRNEQGAPAQILVTLSDTTERKQAEDQLRLSEQRFSNAFYTSPAGMTITRIADGKFVDANESFCIMFEFSRDEVIGHTSTELNMWTPEERKKLIAEQVRSGGLHNFELRARAKSGRMVDILFSSRPMELAGELHHVTTMIDVTARRQAEMKIAEQARMLSEIHDAVLATDENRIVTYWNRAAEEMYGWSAEEAVGKPAGEMARGEFTDAQRADALKQLAETGRFNVELLAYHRNGRSFWVEGDSISLRDADGKTTGYMAINRDITERKRADEEIRRRAEELAALNTLGLRVAQSLSLEEVVRSALDEVAAPLETNAAMIFLREGEKLILKGLRVQPPGLQEADMPVHAVGECLCGIAAGLKQAIFSGDIQKDGRCNWEECKKAGYVSFAALPLQSGEEVLGVLGLASKRQRDFSTQADYLKTLAASVGLGLQNARLFRDVQGRLGELTAIYSPPSTCKNCWTRRNSRRRLSNCLRKSSPTNTARCCSSKNSVDR